MGLLAELTHQEKKSFRLHFLYSVFEGVLMGGILLNEFIFLKSMHGSEFKLAALFVIGIAVYVLLVFLNEFIRRTVKKRVMLRRVGFLTRLPLLLFLFFPKQADAYLNTNLYQYLFLGIFFVYYLGVIVIHPTINQLLKHNYRDEKLSSLYSWAMTANKLASLLVSIGLGILLDANYYAFRITWPLMGLSGMLAVYFLSLIPYTPEKTVYLRSFRQSVKDSVRRMARILWKDKPYRDFEIGFMLYGFAFMFTVTVITLYLENVLHLSYTGVAFYKNTGNLVLLLSMPFFGLVLGKLDPRKFAQISYSFMFLYILFIALSEFFTLNLVWKDFNIVVMVMFAFVCFGLFQAAMGLQFTIGSAYFVKNADEAGDYQAAHLSLVGLRGLFAPFVGVLLYRYLGYFATFMIACVCLLMAIVYMQISYKRYRLKS